MPELRNAKWEMFAQSVAKGMTAEKAYAQAGYKVSEKEETLRGKASELRSNPIVAARIEELLRKGAELALVTVKEIVTSLLRIANADLAEAFNEDGRLKPIHQIPKELRLALNGIDVDEVLSYGEFVGTTKRLKLCDKNKAIENLGRYLKMFTDKVDHSGKLTLEELVAGSQKAKE